MMKDFIIENNILLRCDAIGEVVIPDYAKLYSDDLDSEPAFCSVFDYDNFCDIKDVDFEAG